jgi:hypothetical protein
MIDISSSSFDPMIRYTVPIPIPAVEAIGRPAVCSIWIWRVSGASDDWSVIGSLAVVPLPRLNH